MALPGELNRVQFLRTFVVFLCKKTDKLLATKSSAVTRYVVKNCVVVGYYTRIYNDVLISYVRETINLRNL
jgi:hypothetical protein